MSQCLRGKKPVFGTDLDASALAAVGGGLAFDACSVIMPGMQISQHADRSEALTGLRAEDIHRWIDGLFDAGSFADFKRHGQRGDFEPYRHRKYYASLFQMENKNKVLSV